MTRTPRTTESISRDHETIRDIMHQIRSRLTVPDRATLAVGLVGHLATMMNGRQIEKLVDQLREEVERVRDVPPARRQRGAETPGARPGPEDPTDSTAPRDVVG